MLLLYNWDVFQALLPENTPASLFILPLPYHLLAVLDADGDNQSPHHHQASNQQEGTNKSKLEAGTV